MLTFAGSILKFEGPFLCLGVVFYSYVWGFYF